MPWTTRRRPPMRPAPRARRASTPCSALTAGDARSAASTPTRSGTGCCRRWSRSSSGWRWCSWPRPMRGGECDASLRAGPPGFIRVLDARTLAYPEYRGNGVHASLGNISENGHVGLLMVDFVHDLIGLHVNGAARIVEAAEFAAAFPRPAGGRRAWTAGGALGRGRGRGGLHPLPQAHPPHGAGVREARVGHRRPGPQGRRLLRGEGDAAVAAPSAPRAQALPEHDAPRGRQRAAAAAALRRVGNVPAHAARRSGPARPARQPRRPAPATRAAEHEPHERREHTEPCDGHHEEERARTWRSPGR